MRDLHSEITGRIIAELERGCPPWIRPWSDRGGAVQAGMPYNAASKREYNGINVPILWVAGADYSGRGWLTYKQALDLGGHVRKGERATTIVYAQQRTATKTGNDGEETTRTFPVLKWFSVFNTDQCEGLPSEIAATPETPKVEPDRVLDWALRTKADIRHGGDRAFYTTGGDYVSLPVRGAFKSPDDYAATLLHELTHWTGHERRCNRQFGRRFGDSAYAAEELVAEMGAAFLCARLGVVGQLQHASYIDSWLKILKADKRAIFTAASAASKAAEFITGLADAQPDPVTPEPVAESIPEPVRPAPLPAVTPAEWVATVNAEKRRQRQEATLQRRRERKAAGELRRGKTAWSLAKVKREGRYPYPVAEARFADGETVRWTFYAAKDRPIDWDAVTRQVQQSYRFNRVQFPCHYPDYVRNARRFEALLARVKVPPIVSLREIHSGEVRIGQPDAIAA